MLKTVISLLHHTVTLDRIHTFI